MIEHLQNNQPAKNKYKMKNKAQSRERIEIIDTLLQKHVYLLAILSRKH